MKDKHNVILILVSSKWLIPYSGDSSKFLISFVHFSFRSSKLFQLYHFKASSNHCKASPGVLFNFPFRLIILLLSEFFMEDQHGGSSRILFILRLLFKFSLEAKIRQAILKINMVPNTCFLEFKYSSCCISKCNSFYLSFWGGVISFLAISIQVSRFTCCQEWGILNPSISSLELSWYRFHLKPSLRNVAICGAYQWSKFSPILSAKAVFISSLISSKQLFQLVAGCHLIILRCFP